MHRAVIVTWLAEHAGVPGRHGTDGLAPDLAVDPVGTFTVGDLGDRPDGRFGGTARSDRTVQRHVRRLVREAQAALTSRGDTSRYAELHALFDEAARGVWKDLDYNVRAASHALSSQLFDDLSVEAARGHAQRMRQDNVHPNRAVQALQLAGFMNSVGNRLWNGEHVDLVVA